MLKIKLVRRGKSAQPSYRIRVVEQGRGKLFLEDLGYYNPLTKDCRLVLERYEYWVSCGAQCSKKVTQLAAPSS